MAGIAKQKDDLARVIADLRRSVRDLDGRVGTVLKRADDPHAAVALRETIVKVQEILEEISDVLHSLDARKEPGPDIPLDQVRKELGLA
ncbi:MAG: hypothetical protein L0216_09065 [Planctomycetales bacterium]|nr:hypothetical protein [Planctomycetales bacterium]